jgi:crotonobetaine/carnitine-CoA ligase
VYGVPSEISEDDVKATIVLRPDAAITEEGLFRWAVDHLPYFALPRYVEFRAALPKNLVGRVLKHELRAGPPGDGAWDREAAGITVKRR